MFDASPWPALCEGLFLAGMVLLVWLMGLNWLDAWEDRDDSR